MKTRHQIVGYLALLGLTTLIAILLSVRDQLVMYGPWVVKALLTAIGLVMVYLLHKLYVSFRKDRLALQAQVYQVEGQKQEIEGQKQTLRLENERWQVERDALLLAQQHLASRIYPDQKGYMPTLVTITEAGYQYIQLPHPAHMGRYAQSQQAAIPEQAESLNQVIPTSVRYEQIAAQIPRGHGLLGVSATSVETAEFEEFMTMLISGGSKSGKSNTVGLKINEAIENGRDIRLIVIDWHARKRDSLYNKIRAYESRFLMPVVIEEEETLPALEWFYAEFKRRRAEGSEGVSDILLVIDEVPGMMDAEDKKIPELLKLIARKCGRESRGFGMYGWFIAQQMIGLAWLRNVVHTVIAHKAVRINEAEVACNDHKDIARDMENWPKGRVIVYGQNFQGVRVLQMPIFTPRIVEADRVRVQEEDEMEALQPRFPTSANQHFQAQQGKQESNHPESAWEKAGNEIDTENQIDAFTLKNFLQDARKRRAEGTALNTILKEYGLPSGGRMHQEIQEMLDVMDAQAD